MTTSRIGPGGPKEFIVKPITPKTKIGVAGYDEFNQLAVCLFTEDGFTAHHIRDVRAMICPICQRGWDSTVESLDNQYGLFQKPWTSEKGERFMDHIYCHKTCYEGHLHVEERFMWEGIFCGFKRSFGIEETPNQYGGGWNTPWYEIKYKNGLEFTVGSRRRVFNISVKCDRDLSKDFESEGVITRYYSDGKFHIHAWDKDKAKEYVQRITAILAPPTHGEVLRDIHYQGEYNEPVANFIMRVTHATGRQYNAEEAARIVQLIKDGKLEEIT